MKKMTLTALALLAVFSTSTQAAEELRFGVDPTFAPFEYKGPDGSLQGLDIDLGNAICQQLKMECRWVQTSFDGIIPALQARKFDAILSSMAITEKRRQQIQFTNMTYNIPSALVALKTSQLNSHVETLKGKHIGVAQGTIQEGFAKEIWAPKGVQVVSYNNEAEIYPDLTAGRLDAAFVNAGAAEGSFLKTPPGKDYQIVGDMMYAKQYFGEGTGIGVRKEDSALADKMNQAIDELRASGKYDTIVKKYFSFNVYQNPE